MQTRQPLIATVNVGSSSIKLSAFVLSAKTLFYQGSREHIDSNGFMAALDSLLDELANNADLASVQAFGHRIVFGGIRNMRPKIIDDELYAELSSYSTIDPDHMPAILEVVRALRERFASVPHVACFDSAFYADLPVEARLLAIPRRFTDQGIVKLGYHGLAYTSVLSQLSQREPELAKGKLVLAHLGSGASITAVANGKPIDTTMSYTPTSGIPMSMRSGDLDPTVIIQLAASGISSEEIRNIVNHESGLLGLSNKTADMLALLQSQRDDALAADAVNVFVHSVRKAIGAMTASLGGIDALLFSGGIGERSAPIRSLVCSKLRYLSIDLDHSKNEQSARTISSDVSIPVMVLQADEASVIANQAESLLH